MVWPDLLLLEMFEAVQKDLAIALEVLQHRQESEGDASNPLVLDHMRKIRELQSVTAAPQGAATESRRLIFYGWLADHEPSLIPNGPGSYQKLQTLLRNYLLDA